ncbi:hypothetical protein OG884_26440 [Streptosporangium sp. NBC_01755]|uniref:hypothetical protein n=1 Tax=Streptosporangium sp. NBC_01755 TaxID=2975949 RepID=UPI002DDC8327|nr:hypothetical protein [Streptosporangium sp. NBC_01755]WSC98388.1 hypothetical protein OG884_26440 [Streptosporangium sp. NBC_01755]
MSLSDWFVSWLRTNVAAWVPTVAVWLGSFGIDLPVEAGTLAVGSLLISAFYTLVRLVEAKWPAAGVLLGWKGAPTYKEGTHPGVHAGRDLRGL